MQLKRPLRLRTACDFFLISVKRLSLDLNSKLVKFFTSARWNSKELYRKVLRLSTARKNRASVPRAPEQAELGLASSGAARRSGGFTIVEVLTVIVAASLMFGLIFDFFWQYWQYAEKSQADLNSFTSRLDASDYVREMVGTTSGLITENSIPDPNANVVDPTDGNSYWLTVHSVPQTFTTGATDQPLIYFKHFSQDGNKAFIFNGTNPYEDEYIIYLSNAGQLRVRSLANSSATGNVLKTSCPPALESSSCPADKLLIDDVQSIAARYFSRSGNLLDYTPYYDPDLGAYVNGPDFPAVEVVEYTINLSKAAFTQNSSTTKSSTVIRIALRNA